MKSHFQQTSLSKMEKLPIFFDSEPFGSASNYHLKFKIDGSDKHLVMTRRDIDAWQLLVGTDNTAFLEYELQFSRAVRLRNATVENL